MDNRPRISIIAAIAENRAIGKENKLLWYIPDDMKRFRSITTGHTVLMGRKTHDSIGRLLPQRTNIIITRDTHYRVPGAVIAHSFEEALVLARDYEEKELFIIGGAQIYAQAISYADRLYLTLVHTTIEGDAFFPDYSDFTKKVYEKHGESNSYKYTFIELDRA